MKFMSLLAQWWRGLNSNTVLENVSIWNSLKMIFWLVLKNFPMLNSFEIDILIVVIFKKCPDVTFFRKWFYANCNFMQDALNLNLSKYVYNWHPWLWSQNKNMFNLRPKLYLYTSDHTSIFYSSLLCCWKFIFRFSIIQLQKLLNFY
jgi:hypothetical protein